MRRRVAILGSTGSIGTSALDVARHLPDRLRVAALTAHANVALLDEQVREFRPAVVAITGRPAGESDRNHVDQILATGSQVLLGTDGPERIARRDDVDVVLHAIVGAAGVGAAIAAVDAGKTLALANKESLVVAGSIVMPLARARGATILPVDSEHSAIFQCLGAGRRAEVRRVVLTASGGPFRDAPLDAMRRATVADALRHPTWSMGAKVTIDSATMFNKALEIVEAAWLFDLRADQIEVVVHPQSIVHSMVEFADGSVIAQLAPPDMRAPIQFALTHPERVRGCAPLIDFRSLGRLDFAPPDPERFPSLAMGFDAVRRGGTSGAALNAANEVAVDALRSGRIRLGMIYDVVARTIAAHPFAAAPSLDELLGVDRWSRAHAAELLETLA